ncbi:MAG: hypothetical protein M3Q29_08915 [Chloroflexota bacterium]|nr:hypothetical protein [Chloroflexota bacterium]
MVAEERSDFWREAEERFEQAVRAHCVPIATEPAHWAREHTSAHAWEELARSSERQVREEIAFLWLATPDRKQVVGASRRVLEGLRGRE